MLACSETKTGDLPADSVQAIAAPPGLHEESVAYDHGRNRYVLFGGIFADTTDSSGYGYLKHAYEWDGSRWLLAQHVADAPSLRAVAAMAYDPTRQSVMLTGGSRPSVNGEAGVRPCPSCSPLTTLNDVWLYNGRTWTRSQNAPLVAYAALVFDTQRRQMLLLGNRAERLGKDEFFPILVWRQENDTWALVDSTGPRIDSPVRAAFDDGRNVLVLPILEGPDAGVWEWNGNWRRIASGAGPAARERFVTTYDGTRSQVVIFGGRSADGRHYYNDLWSWNGEGWTRIPADSAPSERSDGALHYEPSTRRLTLIGGLGKGDVLHREAWTFENGRWRHVE